MKIRKIILLIFYVTLVCFLYPEQNADDADSQVEVSAASKKTAEIEAIQKASLRGDYQASDKLLADYKQKYGEDTPYLTEKARYFALNGNPQEALKIVEPLLKADPKNSALLDIKNFALAHPVVVAATSNPEFAEISPEVTAANLASAAGEYKKAVTLYTQALAKNPNDKAALLGLARTYLFLENYKMGESLLAKYKNKFGEDVPYLTEKARDLAFTNHSQQSLAVLEPLLKKDPTNDTLLDIKKYASNRLKSSAKPATSVKRVQTISPKESAQRAEMLAKQRKTDAHAYMLAAKAYLAADDAKKALVMIDHAIKLSPRNGDYVLLKADIANQLDDQKIVYNSYTQLYKSNPANPKIILGLARSAGRLGKLDQSAQLYHLYLKLTPNDKTAWLEYAYIHSWRGNDRNAIWVLDQYHQRFGDSDVYLAARARILSSATRYTESFAIVHRLLPRLPKNYDLNFANTTDFYYHNQPIEMFQSFPTINALAPDSDETRGLRNFIRTPYRHTITVEGYDSFDSDSVKIGHAEISGQYFLTPVTSLIANVTDERLSATISSGLNPIEGGHALNLYGYNVGVNHRFNPMLALQGLVGGQNASDNEKSFNYEVDAYLDPSETVNTTLQIKRAFFDESPLAVSKGIKQNLAQLGVNWQPCIQCYLTANAAYAAFTDKNTMRWFEVHPSAQIISSEKFNVKVGVDGQFYKFGKQLSDGYYNPSNYKYAGALIDIYYKHSDNVGYEYSMGLGTQRDETFTTWRPADDYSLKAYYGIYRNWYILLSAGLSTRGRAIANTTNNGTYRIYSFDISITRRL